MKIKPPDIIIGIDPSIRHNGIAVLSVDGAAMETEECGPVESITACKLLRETAEIARREELRILALIECPTWSGRGTKEVRAAALAWERVLQREFPNRTVRRVDPRAWQRQLLGASRGDTKGLAVLGAAKGDTKALSLRYARLGLQIDGPLSDHQADAACICEYARLMAAGLVSP